MSTYKYWWHCSNCIGMFYIDIHKGTTIKDALKEEKCCYCGCLTLR
ncbi:hypothetical protein LCGC14_1208150 [marine sediment metagenome]|uniref:Uncharacterized protein n=1 Tax=marine sediment metagenome TaxID=412755 RepID=A0A0F9LEV0_9ZZZZ